MQRTEEVPRSLQSESAEIVGTVYEPSAPSEPLEERLQSDRTNIYEIEKRVNPPDPRKPLA